MSEKIDVVTQEGLAEIGRSMFDMVHNFRGPLTNIKGFVQVAETGAYPLDEALAVIKGECEKLEEMIGDVLTLAKEEKLEMRSHNPNAFLRKCTRFAIGKDADVRLVLSLDEHFDSGDDPVSFDERKMELVIMNLVKNAVEAGASEVTIQTEVRMAGNDRFAVISIGDNGKPIEQAILANIFKPFFTTKSKGTGLGLPYAKKIAEAHGGRLEVLSEGQLAKFAIYLPI